MKILSVELENVKRVSLVRMAVSEKGLTVIGGKNAQGKTSILDAICYALAGEKYRPADLKRDGAIADPTIRLQLEGGLIVERKGKNSALKVTDPSGKKAGQALLNSFCQEFALNLPKFMALPDDKKALELLSTMGIEKQLADIDSREKIAYDKRHDFGVVADQKSKFAAELPEYHDVPETPLSASDLIFESQAIIQRNVERQKARTELEAKKARRDAINKELEQLRKQIDVLDAELLETVCSIKDAEAHPVSEDESTAEIEKQINEMEEINSKVRANLDKAAALEEAAKYKAEMDSLTEALEKVRGERVALLAGCELPLPELSIGKDDKDKPTLLYKGHPWGAMSGMERIRVAAAIVQSLKPECRFILLDGLETLDLDALKELDQYLIDTDMQAICTRVSTGEECSLIIEDGVGCNTEETAPEVPVVEEYNQEKEEW